MAALVTGHEPGWRLPQPSALARRFDVSVVEIDCAIQQLIARLVVRRLADGRVYRVSPADYLIAIDGLPGIGTHIDPMGASVSCSSRHVSWRRIPEDIGLMLGIPGAETSVIRCQWTANGQRAALSTTYLPVAARALSDLAEHQETALDGALNGMLSGPAAMGSASSPVPSAMYVEIQAPSRSVASILELRPGAPAITVATRFDGPSPAQSVALTIAVLRCDLFRIVIDSSAAGLAHLSEASASDWISGA